MQVWEPETFWKLFNNTYFGEHLRTSASPFSSIQENSINLLQFINCRSSSPPEVFLGKGFYRRTQRICKFTEEHTHRSMTSLKLLYNFIEIPLWHMFSPVQLLHISRTPFPKNTSGGLLLQFPTDELQKNWRKTVINQIQKWKMLNIYG